MTCPHGTCASCVWHTHKTYTAVTGEVWHYWQCWQAPGKPDERLDTTAAMEPPGCEYHTKEGV
jgi:hypothetical protein